MDLFNTQTQQKHISKQQNNTKKRLSQDQVKFLERTFVTNKKLETELKHQLSNQLNVPPRQIAIWYQNKRARWKTQSLELDYNTLQVKLENALIERRKLEKEVILLREELKKAQEMVMVYNNQAGGGLIIPQHYNYHAVHNNYNHGHPQYNNVNNVSNCNSSCDEGNSSSLHEDVNNGEVLQLDELYACFVGSGNGVGSTWG